MHVSTDNYPDLGPVRATYHKGSPETSREAAEEAALTRNSTALAMLVAFSESRGLTADEVSAKVGRSILYGRPVVTRLKQMGYLRLRKNADGSLMTRRNDSGKRACVLMITLKGLELVEGEE